MDTSTLTKISSLEILVEYIRNGQLKTGALKIKDAAAVYDAIVALASKEDEKQKGKIEELDDSGEKTNLPLYNLLFSSLDALNSRGVFTIKDAKIISLVVKFITDNNFFDV